MTLGATYVTDSLVSTDYLAISKNWLNKAITIGFNKNSTSVASSITHLYANSLSSTCTPNTSWDFVTSLTLNDDADYDWYEVEEKFPDNKYYEVNDVLHVRVRARYLNGETIDECGDVTLSNSDSNYKFYYITVQIRGDIRGPESGFTNYQIDVYEP